MAGKERYLSPEQKKEPLRVVLGKWFSPFQKPEDLPGIRQKGRIANEVEIPFTLEGYGQGRVSVDRDLGFSMENPRHYWLIKPGDKPLTITVRTDISNSEKHYWKLDGKRTPMKLCVELEDIPQKSVYESKDKYKRPYLTTGVRCCLEIPAYRGKFLLYSDSYVSESTTAHEHGKDTVKLEQFFGEVWKDYDLPQKESVVILFPDNDPELFRQIRIKFEKTRRKTSTKYDS